MYDAIVRNVCHVLVIIVLIFQTYFIIDAHNVSDLVIMAKNRLCNDDGLQYVNDLDDCNNTVSKLQDEYPGVQFIGSVNRSGPFPPGCSLYRVRGDLHGDVVFNNNLELSRHTYVKHICWKGILIESILDLDYLDFN